MKKVLLSMVAIATISMTSCGADAESKDSKEKAKEEVKEEAKKDPMDQMCECFEMAQAVSVEMMEAGDDEEKMQSIQDKYSSQEEECDKLGDAMQEEMKDATEEENMAKMLEFAETCPAAKQMMGM